MELFGFTLFWTTLLWKSRLILCGLSDEELLDTKLSDHFDVRVRPRVSNENPANVSVSAELLHIYSLNLNKGELDVTVQLGLVWNDPRLRWDVHQTENKVRDLVLPEDNVWTPDITIINAVGKITHVQDEQVNVESTGRMSRVQTYRTPIGCKTNITSDEQTCVIVVGSWSYDVTNVDLYPTNENFTTSEDFFSHEWEVQNSYIDRVNQTRTGGIFASLEITLNLRHLVEDQPEPTPEMLCMTEKTTTASSGPAKRFIILNFLIIFIGKVFLL